MYRESALLINQDTAEANAEQNIVITVAHEVAHQWVCL
jgi:aminopeptidase N